MPGRDRREEEKERNLLPAQRPANTDPKQRRAAEAVARPRLSGVSQRVRPDIRPDIRHAVRHTLRQNTIAAIPIPVELLVDPGFECAVAVCFRAAPPRPQARAPVA